MTYLLAAQVLARGEDPMRVRWRLGTTQRACFARALQELSSRPDVFTDLRLPGVIATRRERERAEEVRSSARRRAFAAGLALLVALGAAGASVGVGRREWALLIGAAGGVCAGLL